MIANIEQIMEDQRNIVELQLSIKKLKFQRMNFCNTIGLIANIEQIMEDQRNIVELQLSIKKLKFQRIKKPSVQVCL
ncbi:hypothetical protein DSQ20_05030 [Nitrosarchaeum sp. AC2]|nr:hypothetical protein DSQ20_05030 [Nitrosarchaeum sp. AC2]